MPQEVKEQANKSKAKKLIGSFDSLKGNRTNWDTHWEQIARYVIPEYDDIFGFRTPGEKRHQKVYEATAINSNELLSSALHGMLTNPHTIFFDLMTGIRELDQDDEIREWLQNSSRAMHDVLNDSNFQTEIHEVYQHLGSFGTGPLEILEDDETVVRFRARPIYQLYIDENQHGVIDTVYRASKWKLRNIINEFGEDALPKTFLERNKDPQKEFEVIHAIQPRSDFKNDGPPSKFKFSSTYVLREDEIILRESGFREFPYAIPRWVKAPGEVYGRSPAMQALSDIKMINEMMKTIIRAAQKAVDPPILAPDDGVMLPIRSTPNSVNYYRAGSTDQITTLQFEGRIDFGFQLMEDIRNRIREAFYVDQLQLREGPQMTATEVSQRTEEKLRLMGPVLGRQQHEFLKPLVERVFAIMLRKDLLPQPIPNALEGRTLKVQYSSMIAKAQRASESQNFLRAFQVLGPLFQVDPSVGDIIQTDNAARFILRTHGAPEETIRNQEEIEELRELRAEQAQRQQELEEGNQEADQLKKVGETGAKMAQVAQPG